MLSTKQGLFNVYLNPLTDDKNRVFEFSINDDMITLYLGNIITHELDINQFVCDIQFLCSVALNF